MEQLSQRVISRMQSGIWAHSNRYFIYCVGQDIVKQKAFIAWAYGNDIGVKPLLGMYKGQSEQSFISNMKDLDSIRPWLEAEESILVLTRGNQATLHYLDCGTIEQIGEFTEVNREEALARDSWTLDPFSNKYYVTV